MKSQKTLTIVGLIIFLTALGAWGVLVYQMRERAEQNVVTVGKVNITLSEPEYEKKKAQTEGESETGQPILIEDVRPGECILRDPTFLIHEGSQAAYIRAKVVVKGLPEYQKADLLELIDFISDWNYNPHDGYYYFNNPVGEGDEIPFFTSVNIPKEWEGMEKDLRFQVSVFAEVVQASYLTPNISADCKMLGWIPTESLTQLKSDLSF